MTGTSHGSHIVAVIQKTDKIRAWSTHETSSLPINSPGCGVRVCTTVLPSSISSLKPPLCMHMHIKQHIVSVDSLRFAITYDS